MTTLPIVIIPFQDNHQPDIDTLMMAISTEFPESIFSSQSKTIKEIALLSNHKYWVAIRGDVVIGTVGFSVLENKNVELKRLFLRQEFRGQGISKALLDTAIDSAINNGSSCMYLGTMAQFKAAQAFYEKNGFTRIPQTVLPEDFLINPVDTVFYKKGLK